MHSNYYAVFYFIMLYFIYIAAGIPIHQPLCLCLSIIVCTYCRLRHHFIFYTKKTVTFYAALPGAFI